MKKIIALILVLTIVQLSFAQDASSKIDALLTAYNKQYRFNGSALIAKQGVILLNKGYGWRNVTDKIPNDPNSIFQLGSVTKQFTATIILKLQQEKKLNVKDKLSKYFPKYPKGDSITIEQLLTHTSGIYNYTNDEKFMADEVSKPANREKIMALFENKPLDFSPGTGWNYSNSGYSLLGYIIEIVTKKSFEQVVRDYIFTPLQMTNSGFDFTHLNVPVKTTGYFGIDEKTSKASPIVDSTVSFSAGAIYSTTGDLYKWHKALENYSILSKEQQEKAYAPVKNNYGYGWGIDSIDGKRSVGHGGGIHGYITTISRVPVDDVCIIVLSNASDEAVGKIGKDILNLLYNKPYEIPKEKVAITLPEEKLKEYTGEYEIRPDLHVVINTKDGLLVALPTNQSPKELYAEKEDVFFQKTEDIQVTFTRNEKKEVDGFILHQGGGEMKCKKIK